MFIVWCISSWTYFSCVKTITMDLTQGHNIQISWNSFDIHACDLIFIYKHVISLVKQFKESIISFDGTMEAHFNTD